MVELRKEMGIRKHLETKAVRGKLRWAGHILKICEDRKDDKESNGNRRGWKKEKRKTQSKIDSVKRKGKRRQQIMVN